MQKLATFVLMLCFTLSGAFCHASSVAGQENKKGKDGISILIIEKTNQILCTNQIHIK